ncbi:MAG: alanine transaminase [Pseudomonadota bacterium]|jgi:alanine-synthesizing transaminase
MEFARLSVVPPYVFAMVEAEKTRLRAAGHDVIDFGLGNPDQPTPTPIVDRLVEQARIGANHRYTVSKGIQPLREAVCRWYKRRYDVDLDPNTEAVVTLGVKEGLAHLMLVTVRGGDAVLVPSPSYPIHVFAGPIAGAVNALYPIGPGRDHMADIAKAFEATHPRPKVIVTCFPHNPTSATVSLDFFKELVAFAKKKNVLVVQDLAYADMVFEGDGRAPSILQVEGAKSHCVEFFSMSKSYNMPGWRVGFCVGNAEVVGALSHIKTYMDYGHFGPIQLAAAWALDNGDAFAKDIRDVYVSRAGPLVKGLNAIGWPVEPPRGTMFLWAPIPEKFKAEGSFAFAKRLLNEAHVAVSPGAGFGIEGDGYVRFSFIEDEPRVNEACARIARVLKG